MMVKIELKEDKKVVHQVDPLWQTLKVSAKEDEEERWLYGVSESDKPLNVKSVASAGLP